MVASLMESSLEKLAAIRSDPVMSKEMNHTASSWKSNCMTSCRNNYFRNLIEIRNSPTMGGSISVLNEKYNNSKCFKHSAPCLQNFHHDSRRIYEDVCVCSPLSSSSTNKSKEHSYHDEDDTSTYSSPVQQQVEQHHHILSTTSLHTTHSSTISTPTEIIVSAASANSSNPTSPSSSGQVFYWTLSKNLLAGAMARCGAAVIMFPIDVVKTRLQFQRKDAFKQGKLRHHYKHGVDAFLTILKEEGIRGLYKGLSVRLIYITPAAAVSFTVYEQFMQSIQSKVPILKGGTSALNDNGNSNGNNFSWKTPILTLSAGALARVLGTACRTPFDILKQQLQVEGQLKSQHAEKRGIIGTLKTIAKQDGISGFFSGYAVTLLRDAPFAAIYFTSYEMIKRLLRRGDSNIYQDVDPNTGRRKSGKSIHHLFAGALAGAIGTTCTIPVDVVKTRLQTQSKTGKKEYDGIADAFRKIYKEEGWKGFTRGLGPRLIYIMPASALTFTLYEKLKVFFNINETKKPETTTTTSQ